MDASVESLCNSLARCKLLPPEQVRALRQHWVREVPDAADVGRFAKWLVASQYVTEYQASLLLHGHAERLLLGQYKLLDRIGTGRMAGVYKAVHELGPVVAVKILPPSRSRDPQTFARFQREARLAMRLRHPNIVRTFEVGEAGGIHYLVMECLEGETLDEVFRRRGPLPPPEAARLVHQALQGLQYIHEHDMVHRDLKPANLMLVSGKDRGTTPHHSPLTTHQLKILDIGLGRALFDEGVPGGADQMNLTAAGELLGAPEYMAPEQARDAHAADIRADIYTLGCVLYHALAGRAPFSDNNIVRLMIRHATEAAPALSQFNPGVPDGLQQVVNWMMAKDPAQRYPTPQRAAQALEVFLMADAEPAGPSVEPQMEAYLSWLDAHGTGAADTTPPARASRTSSPKLARAAPTEPPEPPPPPAPPAPVSGRTPKRLSAVAPSPTTPATPADGPGQTVVEAPAPAALKKVSPKKVSEPAGEFFNLNRRDWLMMGTGALILAAGEGVGLLLASFLRRKVKTGQPEAEQPEKSEERPP